MDRRAPCFERLRKCTWERIKRKKGVERTVEIEVDNGTNLVESMTEKTSSGDGSR